MLALRAATADGTVVVSGCVEPRGDAYSDLGPASADEALAYHRPQVEVSAGSGVDLLTALTLTNVAEAIGMSSAEAIELVDAETDNAAAYFMINCAHPDHISPVYRLLCGPRTYPWTPRERVTPEPRRVG